MPNSPLRPCLETSCPVLVRGCGRCDQHKHLAPSRFANAQRGTAAATGDRSALAQRGARRAARVAAGVGTEDGCTDATRWPEGAGPKIGPRVRWTATAYRSWRLSEDLDARMTLATVRRYTCPTATWDVAGSSRHCSWPAPAVLLPCESPVAPDDARRLSHHSGSRFSGGGPRPSAWHPPYSDHAGDRCRREAGLEYRRGAAIQPTQEHRHALGLSRPARKQAAAARGMGVRYSPRGGATMTHDGDVKRRRHQLGRIGTPLKRLRLVRLQFIGHVPFVQA